MNRVVILGGRGFLGSALAHLLKDTVPLGSADVNLLELTSVEKLRGIVREGDALVFASALTPDKGKDAHTQMKNLAMGEHVAAVVESMKFSHVVYISSDAVYADDVNPVRETSCASPTTLRVDASDARADDPRGGDEDTGHDPAPVRDVWCRRHA